MHKAQYIHFKQISFFFSEASILMKIKGILVKFSFMGMTGSNAAVAVAGVCGCGRLRFLAVLRDLYDWYCG